MVVEHDFRDEHIGAPELRWTYCDRSGSPLVTVCRHSHRERGKTYRQWTYTDGQWMPGLPKEGRPLYNLKHFPSWTGAFLVCEGEKSAQAAEELFTSVLPTCWIGGTNGWKLTDWTPLKGKEVVLWADNDQVGYDCMNAIAQHLWDIGAKSVAMLSPSDIRVEPPKGWDAYDCKQEVDAGTVSAADLDAAYAKRRAVRDKKDRKSTELRLHPFSETEERPVDWIWPGVIPRGFLSMLAGKQGLGKSYMIADIAARLTRGAPLPDGTKHAPMRVLLLVREDDPNCVLAPRLRVAGARMDAVFWNTGEAVVTQNGSESEELFHLAIHADLLERTIVEHHIDLVFIDPIGAFLDGDQNDAGAVRSILDPLQRVARRTGKAIVTVAHVRKGSDRPSGDPMDAVAGSHALTATPRVASALTQVGGAQDERALVVVKTNLGPKPDGWCWRFAPSETDRPDDPPRISWRDAEPGEFSQAMGSSKANSVNLGAIYDCLGHHRPFRSEVRRIARWLRQNTGQVGLKDRQVEDALEDMLLEASAYEDPVTEARGDHGQRLIGRGEYIPKLTAVQRAQAAWAAHPDWSVRQIAESIGVGIGTAARAKPD